MQVEKEKGRMRTNIEAAQGVINELLDDGLEVFVLGGFVLRLAHLAQARQPLRVQILHETNI